MYSTRNRKKWGFHYLISSPSGISHYVDHRAPAAESPMVLIVDTVAGVVVVFCSHFYARSLSHSVHILCAKSTSYLFSHYFTQNVRYYDALLFGPLFISTAIYL